MINSVRSGDSLAEMTADDRAKSCEPTITGITRIQMHAWVTVNEYMRVNGASETAAIKATGQTYATYQAAKKKAVASSQEAFKPFKDSELMKPTKGSYKPPAPKLVKSRAPTKKEMLETYDDVQNKMIEIDCNDAQACQQLGVSFTFYCECEDLFLEDKKAVPALETYVSSVSATPVVVPTVEVNALPQPQASTPNFVLFRINELLDSFPMDVRHKILLAAKAMNE